MQEFIYCVTKKEGIHGQPSWLLAREAAKCKSSVTITKNDVTVNAKRLTSIMSLWIRHKDRLIVRVEGATEKEDIKTMQNFFFSYL